MHIKIATKYQCCGCTACASICGKRAITMHSDYLGFAYPKVDESLCVDCGKCIEVCQFKNDYNRDCLFSEPIIYGVRSIYEKELQKSQSGAGFFSLSDVFLNHGGLVYGAVARPFEVKHEKAGNASERNNMRGSKYVQSDMSGIFLDIKSELTSGEKVLFTGTPCQVAGLKSYIGKRYCNNLYTIDLLCHGVASPQIWRDYLYYLQIKFDGEIKKVNFRDKKYGWRNPIENYIIGGKEITRTTFLDLYFSHNISRECCSNCPFTNYNRVGDISLGDFWGLERSHKEYDDNKGMSLLFVNSKKGNLLFNEAKDKLLFFLSNKKECEQQVLKNPTKHNINRDNFLLEYRERGFSFIAQKYTKEGWKLRWKIKLSKIIHSVICSK